MMEVGDFVLTPSWAWHDHGNHSDKPMVWLDTLDLHMINLFNTGFREERTTAQQNYSRPDDASIPEFTSGLIPSNFRPKHQSSPVINYKYSRSKEALNSLKSHETADPHFGFMVKYLDPTSGDWALPTLAAQMRLLPAGFETQAYRSTDSTVFSVVEGQGVSEIAGETLEWSEGDTFVAPSWAEQKHKANKDAVIFSISDRAAQEKLGIWREQL
jgi:gentisate 1,2-dioxygenase